MKNANSIFSPFAPLIKSDFSAEIFCWKVAFTYLLYQRLANTFFTVSTVASSSSFVASGFTLI